MKADVKDMAAGAIFIAIGGFFALTALSNLRLGGPTGPGPAFFPVMLGVVLIFLGLLVCLSAIGRAGGGIGQIPWRGVILVTGAVLFFAVGLQPLGFVPALAGAAVMSAKATSRNSWPAAIAISAALTAFCVTVFVVALKTPIALFGPWLGGH